MPTDPSPLICCKTTTICIIICSGLTLLLIAAFTASLLPFFGSFFGLNYPEIYREKNWIQSLATINNITSNAYVCCEKICNECTLCNQESIACDVKAPSFAQPGDEIPCCEVCDNCFGRVCECCARQMNIECFWDCSQCYSPSRQVTFPISTVQKVTVTTTESCKVDTNCLNDFLNAYQLGHKYFVWYNPDNYEEFTFSVSHTWWKWIISGFLLVAPVTFLTCTVLTSIFTLSLCTCLVLLSLCTEAPELIILSLKQKRKRKRAVVSPFEFDKHHLIQQHYPLNNADEDMEMFRELLQASVHDWDSNVVRVWSHIMGWKKYKDLFKFTGADFLFPDYFSDSSCALLTKEIFKGDAYEANLFFSALRCLRLFMFGNGQSPPTLFWDFASVKELLIHTGLTAHTTALRKKKVHLFYLLEASEDELLSLFDAESAKFGKIIREDFNFFVQRLRPELDILKQYILQLSENNRPSFQLVESVTNSSSRISKTFRNLLKSRVRVSNASNLEEEALLSDPSNESKQEDIDVVVDTNHYNTPKQDETNDIYSGNLAQEFNQDLPRNPKKENSDNNPQSNISITNSNIGNKSSLAKITNNPNTLHNTTEHQEANESKNDYDKITDSKTNSMNTNEMNLVFNTNPHDQSLRKPFTEPDYIDIKPKK